MKYTLSAYEAADKLVADENGGWSSAGACALVEYLEALEEDLGEEIEFDAVAFRCEYSEYGSPLEAAEDYGFDPSAEFDDDMTAEEMEEHALGWLMDSTTVIPFKGGVIVQGF